MKYKSFKVHIDKHIANVAFNRPDKSNSLDLDSWFEMKKVFEDLDDNNEVRVIILTGEDKNFCAGMDLSALMEVQNFSAKCEGRKREQLRKFILRLQDTITAIEKCSKPVLAAIHKACIGGGVDIIAACDMRYCSEDAFFSIREVDLGLVADLGTLQRLPTVLNPGILAEMAYTGRNVAAPEAEKIGLVNRVFESRENMQDQINAIASAIAEKSPLVIRGIKKALLYKRDHTVAESLENMATWNAGMLLSDDLMESFQAFLQKRKPEFEN